MWATMKTDIAHEVEENEGSTNSNWLEETYSKSKVDVMQKWLRQR
jgi:hypothetical protein